MTAYVIFAAALVFSWKLVGHLLPLRNQSPTVQKLTDGVTVALLAALVVIQGLTSGGQVVFDARIPALFVSGVLLWLRLPFIVVVLAAAAVAAVIRLLS